MWKIVLQKHIPYVQMTFPFCLLWNEPYEYERYTFYKTRISHINSPNETFPKENYNFAAFGYYMIAKTYKIRIHWYRSLHKPPIPICLRYCISFSCWIHVLHFDVSQSLKGNTKILRKYFSQYQSTWCIIIRQTTTFYRQNNWLK